MDETEQKDTEDNAPSVIDRYYTRWYRADMKGKPCEDHCILQHSNRLCVVTLAETHPILHNGRTIKSINYQISDGCSRLKNKVSGKSKRGGQFLTDFAPLCRISCTDETEYTIYSCIRGRLLEVNERILETPSLLLEKVNHYFLCNYSIIMMFTFRCHQQYVPLTHICASINVNEQKFTCFNPHSHPLKATSPSSCQSLKRARA
ncbi:hypothetical protein JOB18_007672 [Solea senegalensis]|uniref:Protein Abitram n=1 Tax=Solea senegalensis TaxID=28829 RepID=A0AAV6PES5_SOLSE|nr:hypothetical protein JOB18_007672 [Solea senegalensis]